MDRGYLVGATPTTVLYQFFGNFTGVLVMVWRHACSLDIILRLFFVTFSQVELSHFSVIIYNNVNGQGRGYLVGANPTVLHRFFRNFTGVLVMAWRYACCLDKILRLFFVTFSQVELSHFSVIIYNNVNGQGRGNLVGANPTVLHRFFRNFTGVLVMAWRYACCLNNSQIIFCYFFASWT